MEQNHQQGLDLTGINILVVEDVSDAALFLSNYLCRRGASVYTAANGLEGLNVYEKRRPDIVITDVRMPLLDGISMASTIREQNKDTPIIFLTAYSETELLQRCIALEVTEYIIKPVEQRALQQALQNALAKMSRCQARNHELSALNHALESLSFEKQQLADTVAQLIGDDRHMAVQVFRHECDGVSGDFHCSVQSGAKLYVLLADAMGHGIQSVLPALDLPVLFRKLANKGFNLPRIADELNQRLFERGLVNHFIAASLLCIDSVSGLIEVINCGNPDILLLDQQDALLHRFSSNHLAWGIVGGDEFLPGLQQYRCIQGGKIYMASDGLTEAFSSVKSLPWIDAFAELLEQSQPPFLTTLQDWWHALPVSLKRDDATLLEIDVHAIDAQKSEPPAAETSLIVDQHVFKELSVLLVEDDSESREFLSQFLARRVGLLFCAGNGEEGLKLYRDHRPALVIVDMDLPGMNGLTLSERIRALDSEVPIIMISGHSPDNLLKGEKLETLLTLTINKFLPKPLTREKLLDAIRYCFNKYDYIQNLNLSASIFMTAPLAMMVTDAERNIIAVNPAFTQITGYNLEEVLGCNPRILSSGKHEARFYQNMWSAINDAGHWCGEIWNRHKNGELFLEWINITAIYDKAANICNYAAIFSDVTQRAHAEQKIRHLAHHDPLTGLPNRTLFFDRLGQALIHAQRTSCVLAIIYLDIDHFKYINDTLGHSVGDALICEVGKALQENLRESDSVCRLGGDEFAVLMDGIGDEKMVTYLANKLFSSVSRSYRVANQELQIGVSMGICQYPADGDTAETLLKRADNAMYQAKREGRDRLQFFNQRLEQKAERYMQIQQGLYKALSNNEFYVHYQPKFCWDESRTIGAEALIRWYHPTLGNVSPAEFIPVAEESEFIIHLSDWLIDQVCRDLAEWRAYGIGLVPVAINISPAHFHRGNVSQTLLESLTKYRLPASLLQIELTERVVMNTQPHTVNQLLAIKDLGIGISIDDFGTGYSSLSYLRQLPIDELKIDRSFIMEITDEDCLADSRMTAIPSTIIELAQKLRLKLVAEGVETELQRNFLNKSGCNIMQGYLFSQPIDKEAMRNWLSNEGSGDVRDSAVIDVN